MKIKLKQRTAPAGEPLTVRQPVNFSESERGRIDEARMILPEPESLSEFIAVGAIQRADRILNAPRGKK